MPSAPENPTTNRELRLYIASKVGFRPPSRRFSKYHLNSIHAYLTGEFIVKPAYVDTPIGPGARKMRKQLVGAINRKYDDQTEYLFMTYDPGDRDKYPHGRPYRKDQLQALKRAIDLSEDQRDYPDKE